MANPAESVVSKSKTSIWYVKQGPRRFPGRAKGLWISSYSLGSDRNFIKRFLHLEHGEKGGGREKRAELLTTVQVNCS